MAFLIPIVIFLLIRWFIVLGKKVEQMVEEDELQFKKLLTESEQGLVNAQYEIALKYLKGNGTKKDEAKAVYWFEQSAEQGNTEGQFSSARLYSKGKGVNQSYSRAAYWYEKAAQQGHIEAQFRLANIYLEGIGTEQSNSKAFEWTSCAANNEHGQAQSNLGWFYLEGKVVNKDLMKAFEWFDKAVQKDIADAQFYLGLMHLEGIGREVDQDKAAELLMKAAKQNHVEAQYLMGVCYAEGIGVEQNIYLVFHWVSKASDQGYSKAQTELGVMYLTGKNKYAPQNNSKAFNLFLQAARQGHIEAQRQVAKMYYEGTGIEKDIYEADKWLDRSTKEDHSHSEAQPNYDFEYEDKDKSKAQPTDFKLLQITQEISNNDELLSVREGNETIRKFMKNPVPVYNITEDFSTLREFPNPYTTDIWVCAVQDENGKIIGGIDLSRFHIITAHQTMEDFIIRDMPIFPPETSVEDAKHLIYRTKSSQRALIIENNKLVGSISLVDLPDKYRGVMSPKDQDLLRRGEY